MVAEYYMNDCPYAVTNWRHQLDELKAQFLKLENWFSLYDLDIFFKLRENKHNYYKAYTGSASDEQQLGMRQNLLPT